MKLSQQSQSPSGVVSQVWACRWLPGVGHSDRVPAWLPGGLREWRCNTQAHAHLNPSPEEGKVELCLVDIPEQFWVSHQI